MICNEASAHTYGRMNIDSASSTPVESEVLR